MRRILVAVFVLAGCASLPSVEPARTPQERKATAEACLRAFPTGMWSASHSIDATLPLANNALMIGATGVDEQGMTTVLLSPEGLTLFDATMANEAIRVRRALPPFDRQGFAQGLVDDVRAAFFPPEGSPAVVGFSETGERMCRWSRGDERTTDIELEGWMPRWVRMFEGSRLVRETHLVGEARGGWYPQVILRTPGMGGYTLDMRLIDHELASQSVVTR